MPYVAKRRENSSPIRTPKSSESFRWPTSPLRRIYSGCRRSAKNASGPRPSAPGVVDWYKQMLARETFEIATSWPDETGGGYEEVGLRASLPTNMARSAS
jgi:hypothetical protein